MTLRDDPQTYQLAKKFWEKKRVCAFCGQIFTQIDNVGAWKCSMHTGKKVRRPWMGSMAFMNDRQPEGDLRFDCCDQRVLPGQARAPLVSELVGMTRDPVRRGGGLVRERGMLSRERNFKSESFNMWSGNKSFGDVRTNYQAPRCIPIIDPAGCTPCDHREIAKPWSDETINIQDFAPILALMENCEARPGFQSITAGGDISRRRL